MVSRELVAMLHFGSFRRERVWPEALLVRLQRLAEIYAIALTRKRGQEELDQATGFERLATEILASLLVAGAGVDDGAMESSLRKIGLFLGVDRATLWERVVGTGELKAAHRWHSEHVSTSVNPMDSAEIAWLSARPGAGSVVHFGRKTDLGPDLGTDLGTLRNLGVRSMLAVPFSVSDEVAGALSFVSLQEERTWPERLILGLRLLAEVFASVHARRSVERRERAAQLDAAQWRERLAHLVRVHTVGEMSVALAHEINQPLMAIENYALAARRRANGMPESEKVTELLDKVVAQTARAGKVVRRLRGMVKRHDVETSTVNVERLVVECLDIVRMECELREIHLEPSFAGSLPLIVADEIQIQQVILNLLRNAIEAMEAAHLDVPKTITIETGYEPETGIAVRVADCGPGIPEVEMDRVFDAFYSTKITGLGIGLSICRKLIEAHGGTLVARDNPGGGAEFQITLPVANARSDAAS
jgi:signal transduction histidine kinase